MNHAPPGLELKSFDYLVLLAVFNRKPTAYMVRLPRIAVQVGNIVGRHVDTREVGVAMSRLNEKGLICNGRVTESGCRELWG